ncbi:MAG: hypothetical protein JNN00_11145 [Chitinophagaceae bacterium]|nr:hypothetical protein [Chitinophagaceae bacterium]
MKKQILYLLTFSLVLAFTACQKDSGTKNTSNNDEVATHSDDQSRFSSEIDAASNDADIAIESSTSFTGRYQGTQDIMGIICDATVAVNTASNPMTITITYDGTNCLGNRTRTGVIVLSTPQGTQWKNAGAAITVTFQNFKVTRLSDNKSITINGAQTYTNVSGGLLINLATLNSITHSITSNGLTVTFDNGSQRSWQVAKQRVFTYNGGVVVTTTGTHSDGNNSNIAEWGTNRFGAAFTTSITSPLIIRQDCNFRLTSGAVAHSTPVFNADVTFGLNASGNPTSCPGSGNYYYKVRWINLAGDTVTVIRPY